MSKNQEFYHIGEEIKGALDDALKTLDFTRLNDVISSTTNSAVSEFKNRWEYKTVSYRECPDSEKQKERTSQDFEDKRKQPKETQQTALRNVKQRQVGQVSNVLYTVFGGIGTGVGGILTLVFGPLTVFVTTELLPGFVVGALLLFTSIGMLTKGGMQRARLERFRRYLKLCGDRTYCDVKELASRVGKSYKYVLKDLKKMLQLNMLPEGHLDEKGTCLMLDDDTYMQYLETSKNYEGKKEAVPAAEEETADGMTALAQEGQEYIQKLRQLNDEIPGEVISKKLYRLEHVLTAIFEVLADYPQKQPQMRKFMEYYLPTTLKLVQTYADFDGVQIQGENITSAKQEIEQTLDTINTAFEKLLNDLFQDAAFDATTDAQVLQTLLAQEGLTEDAAFKNAGGKV